MDFDEIAATQGWTDLTLLSLLREFISKCGLQDDLNRFAEEKANEENAAILESDEFKEHVKREGIEDGDW